jgi:hypothetical protein
MTSHVVDATAAEALEDMVSVKTIAPAPYPAAAPIAPAVTGLSRISEFAPALTL